ncbi:MAG TPA: XdhC/CoxI family protein [Gaiellaceae bacterium]|nr:XdhC/CoxI family protein [Gaiellaceae bacterium]
MKEILETLRQWHADGLRAAWAIVVRTERSAPREVGAALAVNERGEIVGSVTGGCVEPAVYEEAQGVLSGEPARLVEYGIADETAFEVGLPCGGTVWIFVAPVARDLLEELAAAVRSETPTALALQVAGSEIGDQRLVQPDGRLQPGIEGDTFFLPLLPRPRMYVFGAIDHAAALARAGRLLGYRVTVSDARARFVTPERIPDADELVVGWPDEVLEDAPVDERTAICVLTHDHKLDVPALKAALASPAGYIGAMGSRRTTEARAALLREEGLSEADLARIRAPIGLDIGSRTPAEVAVAIAAEIVSVRRGR